MRLMLAGLAAAMAILTFDVPSAEAQNTTRPYCLRDGVNGPGTWDCSYYSMQQCLDTASGAGGSCQPNPWYRGPQRR
ncbi:MAG: DUF3551 domain-containing protein [Hyphomicrobiales bacterium]|nr:DUF3551 domain-containing protein [Hyphomicrobiales bacterium]